MSLDTKAKDLALLNAHIARLRKRQREIHDQLMQCLIEKIPEHLTSWADAVWFDLKHGLCNKGIYWPAFHTNMHYDDFIFTDTEVFAHHIEELRKNWAGIVDVTITDKESGKSDTIVVVRFEWAKQDENSTNEDTHGHITFYKGDEIVATGEIHSEEYCMVDIGRAIRNGKDPVKAMIFLAESGSKLLTSPRAQVLYGIAEKNTLGYK